MWLVSANMSSCPLLIKLQHWLKELLLWSWITKIIKLQFSGGTNTHWRFNATVTRNKIPADSPQRGCCSCHSLMDVIHKRALKRSRSLTLRNTSDCLSLILFFCSTLLLLSGPEPSVTPPIKPSVTSSRSSCTSGPSSCRDQVQWTLQTPAAGGASGAGDSTAS